MKKIISLLVFFLMYAGAHAQTGKSLDELQHAYQACLDTGNNGYGCSFGFYQQMDSLLNVVYNGIRGKATVEQKENLKDEQLEWLAKREKSDLEFAILEFDRTATGDPEQDKQAAGRINIQKRKVQMKEKILSEFERKLKTITG